MTRVSRADLASLSPTQLADVLEIAEKIAAQRAAGRVPWLCDRPACDGTPHAGRRGPHARQAQRPPAWEWDVWLILAGRGFGKTRTGAEWAVRRARTQPLGALVGPTAGDTRDILVEGESGILAVAPATFRPVYEPSKRRLTYPNGSKQICYSADEPDRLRGPQHHYGWFDELAAWRYMQEAWDMAQLGMRLGDHPQICVTTTPRPFPLIKKLKKEELTAFTTGSTYDNLANLAPTFRRAVVDKYEGTTLGRQELHAEILEDLPGALVARKYIDGSRVTAAPELVSVAVAVDPAGTGTGDETGLVAAARGADGKAYILADHSARMGPREAGRKAWALWESVGATWLVVEDNGGKDWIETVLVDAWYEYRGVDPRTAAGRRAAGPAPLKRVNASQGKALRAQPVALRYEQGRVCHVGVFPELEDQLTTWIPEDNPRMSPDRIDALVHAVTHLMKLERAGAELASPHNHKPKGALVHPAMRGRG